MKYEVFLPNTDFRDFLPMIDRAIFKSPFNPLEVWKKLGNNYNFAMWGRVLKKYRVRLYESESEGIDVLGELEENYKRINLEIHKPKKNLNIEYVKFLLIQTLMHEYVHVNQFHAHEEQYDKLICSYKPLTEHEEYLSRFGELQAFAHCAALDYLNGLDSTLERYKEVSPKTKRAFNILTARWIHKYSELTISNGLTDEPITRSNL